MNIRLPIFLFVLLALVQSLFLLPVAADPGAPVAPVDGRPGVLQQAPAALQACPANLKGANLAQIQTECCKAHKGICGCRAGKIVCCDNSTSTEAGCTCHGDEGVAE